MIRKPLVSCLCVTENRPEFMPWILWNFRKQDYPARELVIVDSSKEPFAVPTALRFDWKLGRELAEPRADVRVIHAQPGSTVAEKRNIALRDAEGAIVTWWDDDDWQHPQRLSLTAAAVTTERPLCGCARSFFLNVETGMVRAYETPSLIFNSLGVLGGIARGVGFCNRPHEDTRHLRRLLQAHQATATRFDRPLFFWLSHDRNLENSVHRGQFFESRSVLRDAVGRWWEDTDDALDALVTALRERHDVV